MLFNVSVIILNKVKIGSGKSFESGIQIHYLPHKILGEWFIHRLKQWYRKRYNDV